MASRLTDNLVRRTLAPAQGQHFLWDDEVKGFALRVTSGGARSFVLDYRVEGRQRRITLGSYPDWSLQAARRAAKDMKRLVDQGHDPMGDRHDERRAPTMKDLWERYQIEHLARKAARSQADERSMWEKIILPRLANIKVRRVASSDIDALHEDITKVRGTPVRANRVIEVLRKAFNLAIRWEWIDRNPTVGVRRNPEEKRHRYLSREEIGRLVTALNAHPEKVSADAIKLLMLTGARRGEVLNASWDQFDLKNGIWVKPSSHTKQRRLHRVPLNGPALRLLLELKTRSIGPFVFSGADGRPLTDVKRSWSSICKTARIEGCRLHDLRHSFASILVSSGASLPLIGQLLGHTQVTTTQRYAHLFDETLRQATEKVASFIAS